MSWYGLLISSILNEKLCLLDTNIASFVGYQDLIEAHNMESFVTLKHYTFSSVALQILFIKTVEAKFLFESIMIRFLLEKFRSTFFEKKFVDNNFFQKSIQKIFTSCIN